MEIMLNSLALDPGAEQPRVVKGKQRPVPLSSLVTVTRTEHSIRLEPAPEWLDEDGTNMLPGSPEAAARLEELGRTSMRFTGTSAGNSG